MAFHELLVEGDKAAILFDREDLEKLLILFGEQRAADPLLKGLYRALRIQVDIEPHRLAYKMVKEDTQSPWSIVKKES